RLERELQWDMDQIRGDERPLFGPGDADRRVQDRLLKAPVDEGHENALRAGLRASPGHERKPSEQHGQDRVNEIQSGSCRSALSATTRMSMPGSSRTIRESSDPPRISRRRDSSGVPTKMYVEPRSAATRLTVSTKSSPSTSMKCAPRTVASRRSAATW